MVANLVSFPDAINMQNNLVIPQYCKRISESTSVTGLGIILHHPLTTTLSQAIK